MKVELRLLDPELMGKIEAVEDAFTLPILGQYKRDLYARLIRYRILKKTTSIAFLSNAKRSEAKTMQMNQAVRRLFDFVASIERSDWFLNNKEILKLPLEQVLLELNI